MPLKSLSRNDWLLVLGFITLYAAGGHVSNLLVSGKDLITLIWIPSGLMLALMLAKGPRWWPLVAASELLFELTVPDVGLLFIIGTVVTNTVSSVLAGLLAPRLGWSPKSFFNVRSGLIVGQLALLTALCSALLGSITLLMAGYIAPQSLLESGLRWALGNFFGMVILTPALLLLAQRMAWRGNQPRAQQVALRERVIWLVLFLTSLSLPFVFDLSEARYPMSVMAPLVILLCWAALRFSPIQTALASLVCGLFMVLVAGLHLGTFARPESLSDVMQLLALSSVMAALPQMLAGAVNEADYQARKLVRQANLDPLTQLPNRHGFETEATARIAAHAGEAMALIYIDVDNFKLINDNASHQSGDEFISGLANALRSVIRPDDLLARLAGDEFVVLRRRSDEDDATALAERLRGVVGDYRFPAQGHLFLCTASLGVVPFVAGPLPLSALLSTSDAACLSAKDLGGNRIEVSHPNEESLSSKRSAMRWAVRLNRALEEDHFELYAQKITPLGAGDHAGRHFEMLLRLRDPDNGQLLPPAQFIAAAERFRMGSKIDTYVVDRTLRFLEHRPWLVPHIDLCAINLSGASVNNADFLRFLKRRVGASPIPPQKLCFEITETAAVRDLDDAKLFIGAMKELGCRLALDDFGTGFCSFAYLRALDVDYFKIDGSFVRDVESSALSVSIVRAIADIARSLGKQCIGEFVENEGIRAKLVELGVDYAQGYGIHKPEPLANLMADLQPGSAKA